MKEDAMVRILTILVEKQGGIVRIPRDDLHAGGDTVLEITEDRASDELVIRVKKKEIERRL